MRNFQSALKQGHAAERAWVTEQRDSGLSVCHGRKIVVAKHNKTTDHVPTPDAVGLVSIEIKQRSLTFTCPEDYPYETVFIDDMRGMGKESLTHLAYVLLSKPTGQWVWVTPLDMDDTWSQETTYDKGRGHSLQVLVSPKSALRSSDELLRYLYPHNLLDLVDGDTAMFLSGGGKTEKRDRYVAATHPDIGGRAKPSAGKRHKDVG